MHIDVVLLTLHRLHGCMRCYVHFVLHTTCEAEHDLGSPSDRSRLYMQTSISERLNACHSSRFFWAEYPDVLWYLFGKLFGSRPCFLCFLFRRPRDNSALGPCEFWIEWTLILVGMLGQEFCQGVYVSVIELDQTLGRCLSVGSYGLLVIVVESW